VDTQTPVEVLSNEIKVESPALPDLGTMKFSFEVTAHRVQPSPDNLNPSAAGCTAETNDSVHCTVFHHTFRYLGSRPIRLGGSCSSPGIWMEYSTDGATWRLGSTLPEKPPIIVPPTHGKPASELTRIRVCGRNVYADKAVFPGVESEGEITLATLLDEYDTTPLSNLAEYQVRFNFLPMACFASPDGSFCLLPPQDQPKVVSNEVTVVATESPSANTPK
jgi:hypothetical protein